MGFEQRTPTEKPKPTSGRGLRYLAGCAVLTGTLLAACAPKEMPPPKPQDSGYTKTEKATPASHPVVSAKELPPRDSIPVVYEALSAPIEMKHCNRHVAPLAVGQEILFGDAWKKMIRAKITSIKEYEATTDLKLPVPNSVRAGQEFWFGVTYGAVYSVKIESVNGNTATARIQCH